MVPVPHLSRKAPGTKILDWPIKFVPQLALNKVRRLSMAIHLWSCHMGTLTATFGGQVNPTVPHIRRG